MIRLEKLEKTFHPGTVNENPVIRGLDLHVRKGDFITIIGSNGAGKSTLFHLIAGTLMPSGGKIFFEGKNLTREPEYRRARYLGRIFQDPLLGTASNMTLEDNMMIARKKGFKGLKISLNQKLREEFQEQLKILDMNLEGRLKDNVGLLSGGQRQALTLLMAALSRPALLLLDEHTAALDPKNAQKILDLTSRFIEEYNLTTMMITHNMSYAIKYGNRLLMLDQGEIILDLRDEEKVGLTVDNLVERFHSIRKERFLSDETLLS